MIVGCWNDGGDWNAEKMRLLAVAPFLDGDSPITVRGGIRWTISGDPGRVQAASTGLAVTVEPFIGVIRGSTSASAAGYPIACTTQVTVPLTPAHASLGRCDLIVARVIDTGMATTTYDVVPIDGAPMANPPQPPDVPDDCEVLAQVVVPAQATTPGTITDLRQWLSAPLVPSPAIAVQAAVAAPVGLTSTDWQPLTGPSTPFTAPASGRVAVSVAARITLAAAGWVDVSAMLSGPGLYRRLPSDLDVLHGVSVAADNAYGPRSSVRFLVSGLTPGSVYTATMVGRVNVASVNATIADRLLLVEPQL